MHIHFIGICGTFMAGLARLALELGHQVTGSDREFYPPMSDQLVDMGVKTYRGFEADIWDVINPDLVIVGNICSRGMPIIEAMLEKKLNYTHGPQWLGEQVLKNRYVFAIAGTHGKTTTTAMLTHILRENGIDTGYLVGGVVPGFGNSSALGSSSHGDGYFVIEADEYDSAYFDKRPKLLHYEPDTLVIGNVEFDHADIYDNVEQIERQFHYGVRLVPPSGTAIFGRGEHVIKVRDQGVWSNVIDLNEGDYVLNDGSITQHNRLVAKLPQHIIGIHNQTNAMIACLAAQQAGINWSQSGCALATFKGVKRRLELLAEINGIAVYDDFAHHPTAVELTLTAMRERFPDRRLVSVLEPRSNTMRMGEHAEQLPAVLATADRSYVYLPEAIQWQLAGNSIVEDSIDRLLLRLSDELRSGDIVVMMSNGSFEGLHGRLIKALRPIRTGRPDNKNTGNLSL
ncbi:MAG: UDP-N-acetylmuramate:L-alanyl-gamma-D-glutamyl-meso-diaminopimelate ligase [Gammaproteobacteria bacterium]|nr:MAG: UDP-N-acetylmuramate:L-alanyl-gamma-D-glutamyl-meso-diaminopimelate ligase [Gammaproteobacteria bacterium]